MLQKFEAKDALIRARVQLQRSNPFFSYLVMHLNFTENNNMSTCGVDKKGNLYYNKNFIESLDEDKLIGLLCHEVLHVALEHPVRLGKKFKLLFDIACDLVINDIIISEGMHLPNNGLIPSRHSFNFCGVEIKDINEKNAEIIYDEIAHLKDNSEIKALNLLNLLQDSIISDSNDEDSLKPPLNDQKGRILDEKSVQETIGEEKDWKKILTEAYVYAKQMGKEPLGAEMMIKEILSPTLNWREILWKFILQEIPIDYSLNRPSKRSQTVGIYLPSVVKESAEIAVAIDTSGSISQKDLNVFASEIVNIIKSFDNIKVHVLVCDCKVYDHFILENGNIDHFLNLKLKGEGGTSHIPVFDFIKENLNSVRCLICLTDGYTEYPKEESIKTLWCLSSRSTAKPPFGEVIKIGGGD